MELEGRKMAETDADEFGVLRPAGLFQFQPTDADKGIDWPMSGPVCPVCSTPLTVGGKGTSHWYECPEHGPQDPEGTYREEKK